MSGRPSLLKSATTGSEICRRCEIERRCERAGSVVQLDDDPTTFTGPHQIDVAVAVEVSNDRALVCLATAHVGRRGESAAAVADVECAVRSRSASTIPTIKSADPSPVRSPTLITPETSQQRDRRRRLETAGAVPEDDHQTDAVVVGRQIRVAVVVEVIDQDRRLRRRRAKGGRRLERAVSVAEPDRDDGPAPLLPSARSALPSRLKSAVTTVSEPFASGIVTGAAKPPRPLPRSSQASCNVVRHDR